MSLYFNGVEIPEVDGNLIWNGVSYSQLYFNGVLYWEAGSGGGPGLPPVPNFLDASDDLSYVYVTWGYSHYNAGYALERKPDLDGNDQWGPLAQISSSSLWYEDFDTELNVPHMYRVKACWLDEPDQCSAYSEEDEGMKADPDCSECVPQTAPFELLASDALYYDRITLTWKNGDVDNNVNNINVYRDGMLMDVVPYPDNNYIDHNVSELENHDYYLAYRNYNGIGPYSNTDAGSTAGSPADPTCTSVGAPCGSWSFDGTNLTITVT